MIGLEIDRRLKKKVSAMLELPKEIVMNLPLVTLIGGDEIQIENFKGVVEFTDKIVRISTACGIFKVEGKSLLLKHITSETIMITGRISRMEIMR